MPGFAPAVEILLFGQKDPKPFPPGCIPPGSLAPVPIHMAAQLAALKQCSPNGWIQHFGSAAPNADLFERNHAAFNKI